jgi:hypothetical protein
MSFEFPVISADSHITEPPDCYTAHIDPAFRDRAPHMVTDEVRGDVFVVPGMGRPIAIGLVAAAGKPPEQLTIAGVKFDDIHRSGWDSTYRLADQDRDGVSAQRQAILSGNVADLYDIDLSRLPIPLPA